MSHEPASISDLIDRWKTITAFAADLGCGYEAARQMRRRGKIAPSHWASLLAACERREIAGITYEWLARQWSCADEATPTKEDAA